MDCSIYKCMESGWCKNRNCKRFNSGKINTDCKFGEAALKRHRQVVKEYKLNEVANAMSNIKRGNEMFAVQKWDREKGEWKNLYISSKQQTARMLEVDLMDLRPTTRYRTIEIDCTHPAIVTYSEAFRAGDRA